MGKGVKGEKEKGVIGYLYLICIIYFFLSKVKNLIYFFFEDCILFVLLYVE